MSTASSCAMGASNTLSLDPYRIFFPLGALAAILGTVYWVSFGFGFSQGYPGAYHPDMMVGAFLFAFVSGFLMTAVPRFTGSSLCRRGELALSVVIFTGLLLTGYANNRTPFHLLSVLSFINLAVYAIRRVLTRTYNPPRFFLFVGLGILMGISGAASLALADLGLLAAPWIQFGKSIYTQGMILSLTVGVGTHLLPAIWDWSDLPIQIRPLNEKPSLLKTYGPVLAMSLLLIGSFFVEVFVDARLGWAIRSTQVTFLGVSQWHILKKPRARGRLAFWLWISAWSLAIGLWVPVVTPQYFQHGIHIAFIGGFGLMSLLIAGRVTLAHGGYGHRLELRSRLLTLSAVLVLAAALTRALAAVAPSMYLHHLAYAAATWIAGIAVWSILFIPKCVRKN